MAFAETRPMRSRSAIIVGVLLGLAVHGSVHGKSKVRRGVGRSTFDQRLQQVQLKASNHGIGVAVSYALTPLMITAHKPGVTLGLTRSSAFTSKGRQLARVSLSSNRITVMERRQSSYSRRMITLLDPGLAVSTSTGRVRGKQHVSNHVIWKNAQAAVKAPLSASKLQRLKVQLDSQQHGVGSLWRKLFIRERARPASELKRALRAIGVPASIDWR